MEAVDKLKKTRDENKTINNFTAWHPFPAAF